MIIEIVGSAGAGKTTIADRLREAIPDLCYISDWRRHSSKVDIALGVASLFPLFLATLRPSARRYTRQELQWMLRLVTSYRTLRRLSPQLSDGQCLLLDQGPIYTLMRLAEQAGEIATEVPQSALWQTQMLTACSHLLDRVIWLDAPDALLVDRVFTRPKSHWLQLRTREDAVTVLQQHRRIYQRLLGQLEQMGRCSIARYDTASHMPAALATQLCTDLYRPV